MFLLFFMCDPFVKFVPSQKIKTMKKQILSLLTYFTFFIAFCIWFPFAALSANTHVSPNQKIQEVFKAANKLTPKQPEVANASSTFRINNRVVQTWSSAWDTSSRELYTYINSNWLRETNYQVFVGSTFDNNYRTRLTYNGNGDVILEEGHIWNSTSQLWINDARDETTYDVQGNETQWVSLTWSTSTSSWDTMGGNRTTYTYNGSNQILTQQGQYWFSGVWINQDRMSFTYNGSNQISELLIEYWNGVSWDLSEKIINISWHNFGLFLPLSYTAQTWDGTIWENNSRATYTYNASNLSLTELYESWSGNVWSNDSRIMNTYTGALLTLSLYQEWTGSWKNVSRESYTYDTYGNQTEYLYEEWNLGSWSLYTGDRHVYTYDGSNNILTDELSIWDDFSSSWQKVIKYLYNYDNITGMDHPGNISVSLYPNPAAEIISITGLKISAGGGFYSVYSMTGSVVMQENFSASQDGILQIDASMLNPGLFMIRLESGNEISNIRFVKK
jgi:hypothetical protein